MCGLSRTVACGFVREASEDREASAGAFEGAVENRGTANENIEFCFGITNNKQGQHPHFNQPNLNIYV